MSKYTLVEVSIDKIDWYQRNVITFEPISGGIRAVDEIDYQLPDSYTSSKSVNWKYWREIKHPLTEDKYYYADVKPNNPNPEWFTDKPMYVYYSDESEAEATASKRVGLLVSVECHKATAYPYTVAPECNNVNETYPNIDFTSVYAYVIPIERVDQEKQNEIDSIKEELTKLNERLSKLEG